MSLSQLLNILWARRLLIAAVAVVFVLPALLVSLTMPKTYAARASIVVDAKGTDPVTGATLPALLLPGYMSTQVDIISSHNVALKVVDQLGLAQEPGAAERYQEATAGRVSLRDWLAESIGRDLAVRPSRDSSIISIEYAHRDPARAAQFANAFVDGYIQTSLELRVDPARRQAEWFEQQVASLRTAMEQAQRRHSAFRKANGIVGGDSRLDLESGRLAEISTQLVEAQAAMYEAQSRLEQVRGAGDRDRLRELPDILGNALLQGMKVDLLRAEARFAETAQRFGRQHPQYLAAQADVQAIRARMLAEIDTASGAMSQAHALATTRVAELQRALDRQKTRVLELKQQQDQLDVLTREVASAERAYDVAQQRASQVRLESRLDQTNIAVLNPAVPPVRPLKTRLVQGVLLALAVGVALGALLALVLELRDRRVRSREDIDQLLELDMLMELPRPEGRALERGGPGWFGR